MALLTKVLDAKKYMGLSVSEFLDSIEREMETCDEVYVYFPDWTLYDEAVKTVRRWCFFRMEMSNSADYFEEYYWKKA